MSIITITDGVYAPALCLTGWVGDLLTIPIQVNDANGNPEDLSSGSIGLTVKGNAGDSDDMAFYKNDVTPGPSNGGYTWLISGSGASSLSSIWWSNNTTFPSGTFTVEIVKWDAAGNRNHLQTGQLVILPSITQRASPL